MAEVLGSRSTANILQARRKVDMKDLIFVLDLERTTPLALLLSKLGKKPASSVKFECIEDLLINRSVTVSGAHNDTGATTITLAASQTTKVTVNDILEHTEGTNREQYLVTAVPSSTTITVERSWGGTTADTIADASVLRIVGQVNAEDAGARPMKTTLETTDYNYIQIFRNSFGPTWALQASALYGGDDREYQRRKMGVTHARDIEYALWFGRRGQNTTDTTKKSTGGVRESIATNITNNDGTLNESEWETFIRDKCGRYGPKVKYAFHASIYASAVNSWSKSKLNTFQGDETYGVHITQYVHGDMRINMIKHDLFGDATNWSKLCFVLDLNTFKYRFLKGLDTTLETNIQDPDQHIWKDEYYTYCGLDRPSPANATAELHNALMTAVTAYAA